MTTHFFLIILLTASTVTAWAQQPITNPNAGGIRNLLGAIFTEDQTRRQEYAKLEAQFGWGAKEAQDGRTAIRQLNTRQLKTIDSLITLYGYPGKNLVGQPADQVAFMVIQQSNSRVVHEKYLPIIQEAATKGELDRASAAFLTDQVRVERKEKQIYGTQIRINNAGQRELYPIENEADIERLRKEMDLEPLPVYLRRMGIQK
jgi:hypothetical protein